MSLVPDYGSDSEDNESNDEDEVDKDLSAAIQKQPKLLQESDNKANGIYGKKTEENIEINNEVIGDDTNTELFSKLPYTKPIQQNITNEEDQIEDFVPKSAPLKEKQKVKITIPSLKDFENDQDEKPTERLLKSSSKSCGLLSLLPPVKGSVKTAKSFVPNSVANKKPLIKPSKVYSVAQKQKTVKEKPQRKRKLSTSDTESETDDIEIPETFDDEMWQKVCGKPKPKPIIKNPEPVVTEPVVELAPEPEKPYDGLDNEAFKELVGKTKRPIGNIKLIDINEEEILSDKDLWMTKSLTDPEMAPKADVEDPVDPTRRKKHHITYLAQQAKANEQELANAWAASKNNRLASRAKYGF